MHEAETRALRRAAMLLIAISLIRWGWSARPQGAPLVERTVLPELLEASREATAEGVRRAAPFGEGERVDPNRADEVELDRLPGIGGSTARAIVAAREGGMVFIRPEDLLSVPGIGPATLQRIRSSLLLDRPPLASARPSPRPDRPGGLTPEPERVDLNGADLEGLQRLPGIGPALAERILVARREQPFTSLDDLVRVRGIGQATVERLRSRATVGRRP